ncbi:MAG: tetratricopeptide repeat protein [Sandaracinaceae bacterium]|nr:tetratricopeptide repeat protein [Sandaracinaceae bacterium]
MSTGGVGSANLDTRLLRYRSRGGEENPIPLVEDLLAAGRTPEAQEVVARAIKDRPEDGDLLLLDGRARFAAGDLLGAQASLLKSARVLPSSKGPFRWLGEVLLKRGDPARAAKVLERALALDPSDRAVQLLLDRAKRLERVSDAAGDEAPPPKPEPPPPRAAAVAAPPVAPAPPEERTVIRNDLTDHLRELSRDVPEAGEDDSSEASMTAPLDFAAPSPTSDAFYGEFEDEPTNLMDGRALRAAVDLGYGARPKIQKTLGFGAPGAAPAAPPARPAPPRDPIPPPRRDEGDGITAVEPFPAPSRKPATSTSPGAAIAPAVPPPRRRLPSQRAPEPPPEPPLSARPGQPSPWDDLSEEIPVEADPEPVEAMLPPLPRPAALPREAERRSPAPDPFAAPARPDPFGAPARPDPFVAPPSPPDRLAGRPSRARAANRQAVPPRPAAPEPAPPRADPFAAADAGALAAPERVPEAAPDVVVRRQASEDVDEILRMLQRQGLFEPPSDEGASWAARADVKAQKAGSGTRTGLWLGLVWLLAIGLVVGGWFGWQAWMDYRRERARELIAAATREAYAGDHRDLVDAERHLREARDLDPHDVSGPTLLLFVHSQRALEDGAFSAGYLRPAIQRAEALESEDLGAYLDAARAVLAAAEGGHEEARTQLAAALAARPRDPAILYLVGRLEQRLGSEDALTHLEAATEGESTLNAPRVALAEARYDGGEADEALELLDHVLANRADHLRARLWRAFMTSDAGEPDALLGTLETIAEHLSDHGAPTDHVVYQLTRARLLRRKGEAREAGRAVDQALRAGASEPRLLSVVAIEARRAGRLSEAETAARTAVTGAPSNVDLRKLLAEIQLARRNGRGALTTLAELSSDDPDVVAMRGQAALLLGTEEALAAAAEALEAHIEGTEEASVEVRALRIRIRVRQGAEQEMLPIARQLAAEAPGDPSAALALGETALRARDATTAVEALETVVSASPDDAEGHFLLGRARRMASDGEGARRSLERAVELSPEHLDAKLALGGLLLDLGDFEAADTLYSALARSSRVSAGRNVATTGRLGRVEALLGLGRLDDAQVQLEGIREDERDSATYRVTAARLLLARGQAGAALQQIRPLATGEEPGATVLALYGDALLAARQVEPAQEAYAAAVAADAASPEALIGQAEMAVRSDRERDAIELLDRARSSLERRIRPPSLRARMLTLYGRAYLLGNRTDAARRELEQAIELAGAPAEAHFFLGESWSSANSATARTHYERYLELAPDGPFAARARRGAR